MLVTDIFLKVKEFFKQRHLFCIKKYNLCKARIHNYIDRIKKSKVIKFIKEKLFSYLIIFFVYGLLINFITWKFLHLEFNLLSIFAWGGLFYLIKTEILEYLVDLIIKIKKNG